MTAARGVILFHTSAAVFRAERLLGEGGLPVKLVPTPREFSSDCGIALSVAWSRSEDAVRRLRAAGVEIVALHPLE